MSKIGTFSHFEKYFALSPNTVSCLFCGYGIVLFLFGNMKKLRLMAVIAGLLTSIVNSLSLLVILKVEVLAISFAIGVYKWTEFICFS